MHHCKVLLHLFCQIYTLNEDLFSQPSSQPSRKYSWHLQHNPHCKWQQYHVHNISCLPLSSSLFLPAPPTFSLSLSLSLSFISLHPHVRKTKCGRDSERDQIKWGKERGRGNREIVSKNVSLLSVLSKDPWYLWRVQWIIIAEQYVRYANHCPKCTCYLC